MNLTLITPYYKDKSAERQQELDHCINKNLKNPAITRVILMLDEDIKPPFKGKKVQVMKLNSRPTYKDAFELANKHNPTGINILCNTDIFFHNDDLEKLKLLSWPDLCLALSRWDLDETGSSAHFGRKDSQDAWIWQGKMKDTVRADFMMGKLGSDNRIAHELTKGGYRVINPSRQIRPFHFHLSGVRNYDRRKKGDVIPPPYKLVDVRDMDIPEEKQEPNTPEAKAPEKAPEQKKQTWRKKGKTILHVALNAGGEKQHALKNALESLGSEYVEFDWIHENGRLGGQRMREELIRVSNEAKPDFTFMQVQRAGIIDSATLRQLNGFIMNWTGDVRTPLPKWYKHIAHQVDVSCFSNMHDVQIMRNHGHKADYLQIGYDQEVFYPREETCEAPEIVFMANHYRNVFPLSRFRKRLADTLKSRYRDNFKVYGRNWPFPTEDLNGNQEQESLIYKNCKIAINCSHFEYSRYSSDRIFRIMASGAFCLTKWYPDIELDFKDGKHLRTFRTLDELLHLTKYYLENESERKEIQEQGTELVQKKHTWKARTKDIRKLINEYIN